MIFFIFDFSSENESPAPSPAKTHTHSSNIADKKRIIDQKLQQASTAGQKPSVNAIALGFQPSRQALAGQVNDLFLFLNLFIWKFRMMMTMRKRKLIHLQPYTQILQENH